jgi:hypothetical protein
MTSATDKTTINCHELSQLPNVAQMAIYNRQAFASSFPSLIHGNNHDLEKLALTLSLTE